LQAKIGLAMILKNFKFETCEKTPDVLEYKKKMTIMLSAEGGIVLKVTKI
jgi:cytochrome P450 family 6